MKRATSGAIAVLLACWMWVSPAHGLYLDDARTFQVIGKVLSQASWRMEGSDSGGRACAASLGALCTDFTFPTTQQGQLIQHRNLIEAEIYHDLGAWLGPGFTLFDPLTYRVRVKYFYDGVYDYGPDRYRNPSTASIATDAQGLRDARHVAQQHDPLVNAYVDLGRDRWRLRVGRQDLSWGETDGFRLLDMIEPLDSRFGFPLVEDLDDRRIPLWMVRPTVNIGTVGPFSNLTFDGYWVPGAIDNQEAPLAPTGNPFGAPSPPGRAIVKVPEEKMSNSRGGGRIFGTIANQVNFSIGHYVTFNDLPSARLSVEGLDIIPLGDGRALLAPDAAFLIEFYRQEITGASASFALPFDPLTIVRIEAAQFWNEKVFTSEDNVESAFNEFVVTQQPSVGRVPTKDIMRWMIGFDRNVWIRWLNKNQTFLFSMQYFHNHIFDFERKLALPAVANTPLAPALGPNVLAYGSNFVPRKNDEIFVTYLINTLYWHGNLTPQIFGAYDTRGVHAIVPSITYQLGTNVQLAVKYAIITGTFANLGFFRDRDQLLFRVQYNLS